VREKATSGNLKDFDRSHPVVFRNNIVIYSVNNTTYIGNQFAILILITNICCVID